MTECYHFSCQGESHKITNKPCQDYSYSTITDKGICIAIVCDGHGGERYFRSDVGARFATDVACQATLEFVDTINSDLFIGKPYTAKEAITSEELAQKPTSIDNVFRQLFSSIIYQWNERISVHAKSTPVSEWEQNNVEEKYLNELKNGSSLEKIYGCTLMVFVRTPNYWFAYHLGDGKCLSFQENPIWQEPIPWDERCFLNKTTSICDADAINEFRYCYQGDGQFPMALFLGSDGLDDSFGETENLANFYIQIIKLLVREGLEKTVESIEAELPKLSAIGSKDDMSVAFVYDIDSLKSHIDDFIQYQIQLVTDQIQSIDQQLEHLQQKLPQDNTEIISEKDKIEADYARQGIDRANEERLKLIQKKDILSQQLTHSSLQVTSSINDEEDKQNIAGEH